MKLEEKTMKTQYIYKGRILNFRNDTIELPNGRKSMREVVEHPGGVCIAALTDERELLFVNQYRYPYKSELLELPAGKLNRGENPLECGKRELLEETGATAARYQSLGKMYPSPGYTDEIIHLFLAEELSFGDQQPDEDEFLDVVRLPLERAVQMVEDGTICDAKSQILILKIYFLIQKNKEQK